MARICLVMLIGLFLEISHGASAKMPLFSWDTVPVFVHMCNASGPFSDATVNYLTRFPMVTVEKGQGLNSTNKSYASQYAEEKILESLKRVKEINSSITTILYLNSILDWTMYQIHEIMLQHPEWWLHDENGNVVRIQGDHTFPQPAEGMLVFDHQQSAVQSFWTSACLNWTYTGYVDGCFADRPAEIVFKGYNLTDDQTKAFAAGHAKTLLSVQRELNMTHKSVLISNGWYAEGIMAVQLESFAANNGSIKLLQKYAQKGIIVQAHAGYGADGEDNHCEDITNSLAAFLIGAGKYSYFGCARGWYIEPDWIKWHDEYDKPLGIPDGDAVLKDGVYFRSFSSGTHVLFDTKTNTGTIQWAA